MASNFYKKYIFAQNTRIRLKKLYIYIFFFTSLPPANCSVLCLMLCVCRKRLSSLRCRSELNDSRLLSSLDKNA